MTPTQLPISPAAWWELQARSKDVALAEGALLLARARLAEAQRAIVQAHGGQNGQDYELVLVGNSDKGMR